MNNYKGRQVPFSNKLASHDIYYFMDDFDRLVEMFDKTKRDVKHFYFGKSAWGRKLCCFELGEGSDCILLQGGMHAREYITSFLLLKIIDYLKDFVLPYRIFVVPIMNPDGIEMCIKGKQVLESDNLPQKYYGLVQYLLANCEHKLYKANGRGVDLNVNFDCDWGQGKNNFFGFASGENYVGSCPNSESETKSLIALTKESNPFLTISFHSKGEVVYYGYKGQSKKSKLEQKKYLKVFTRAGYKKCFTRNSCGGYKDYCLMNLDICAFTLEIGEDNLSHPIKHSHIDKLFSQNKNIVLELLRIKSMEKVCKNIL